ncbi:hypothetical protein FBY35_0277 [Streptomyces sp. SLBN-118]|nr:hypothetical protein FBY35_0277 [Streptomyces sp. SLBN-118]
MQVGRTSTLALTDHSPSETIRLYRKGAHPSLKPLGEEEFVRQPRAAGCPLLHLSVL